MSNKSKSNAAIYAQYACLGMLFYGPSMINGTKKVITKTTKIAKKCYRNYKWKVYDKKKMEREVEVLEQMWSNPQ